MADTSDIPEIKRARVEEESKCETSKDELREEDNEEAPPPGAPKLEICSDETFPTDSSDNSQERSSRGTTPETPVSSTPPTSSGEDSTAENEGFIRQVIKPHVSDWKWVSYIVKDEDAGEEKKPLDLLVLLKIDPTYKRLAEFIKIEDVGAIWKNATSDDAFRTAEDEYLKFLHDELDFDVPEVFGSTTADFRRPFGAYPEQVDHKIKSRILEQIFLNLEQLRLKKQKLDIDKYEEWSLETKMQIAARFERAEWFLEKVVTFLSIQKEATEGAIEELFLAFCRMVGLNFSRGYQLRDRKENVLGVAVSSRPDLRAFSEYLREFKLIQGGREFPQMKTTVVVEVKAGVPSHQKMNANRKIPTRSSSSRNPDEIEAFAHVGDVLGQLVGEMLLEIKHAKYTPNMFGMCVQGSRVQLVFLHLNNHLEDFIFSDGKDSSLRRQCKPGQLYISETKNFLKKKDRNELLSICRELAAMCAR